MLGPLMLNYGRLVRLGKTGLTGSAKKFAEWPALGQPVFFNLGQSESVFSFA